MTMEELDMVVQAQVKIHFTKKPPVVWEKVMPCMELRKKVKQLERQRHEANKKPPLSDYECYLEKLAKNGRK